MSCKARARWRSTRFAAAGLRGARRPPSAITPELIAAAKKEGKVVWYTSIDLAAAERIAKSFEAKYPGIPVRVERSGAERVFQRIGQEYSSRIFAVDVVNTSDAAHFIVWKRNGWLAPYVPEDVAKHFPAEHKDADGMFASVRVTLCPIAYNTNLVKAEEAPKSYADLLDPKWAGKIVKAHPSYSGTILTATYQIARDIGWSYLREARPAARHAGAVGDRSAQEARARRARHHGRRRRIRRVATQGKGRPDRDRLSDGGHAADRRPERDIQECAQPERRAAVAELHVLRRGPAGHDRLRRHALGPPQTKEKPGRKSLSQIKLMKDDAAAVERESENIKKRYSQIFKV